MGPSTTRRALALPVLPALCFALTTACGGTDGSSGSRGNAGLDSPDFSIAPSVETVYTVGVLEGEPWETFGSVSTVAFDTDGNLFILDRDAAHVVMIDAEGRYVRTISNKGEGPGELASPFGMVVLRDGRVAVFDFNKQGFQVFSREGDFLESVTFNPQDGMPGGRIWALPDHSIISAGGIRIRMTPDGPLDEPSGRPIDRFGLDGSRDLLYTAWEAPPPEGESTASLSSGGNRMMFQMPKMRAFEPPLHVGVLWDGRVAVVDSVGYRVKLIDADGIVGGLLERPIAPTEVTSDIADAERERQLAELAEGSGGGGGNVIMIRSTGGSGGGTRTVDPGAMTQMMEDRVRDMVFADEIPTVRNMSVDWSDRIWIERSALPGETGPTDVLTSDGQYLGTIAADGLRIPAAFGPGGLMAYIESDELEVQRVRVARLQDDEALEGSN